MTEKTRLATGKFYPSKYFRFYGFFLCRFRGKPNIATFRRAIRPREIGMAIVRMPRRRSGMRPAKRLRNDTRRPRGTGRTHEAGASAAGLHGTKTSPLDRHRK